MVDEDTAFGVSENAELSLPWHWAALPLAGGDGCWVRAVGTGKPAPACLCQHPPHLAPWHPQIPSPTPLQGIPRWLCCPCPLPSPGGGFLLSFPSFTFSLESCQDTRGWAETTAIPYGLLPLHQGAVGVLPTALAFEEGYRPTPHSQQLGRSLRNIGVSLAWYLGV